MLHVYIRAMDELRIQYCCVCAVIVFAGEFRVGATGLLTFHLDLQLHNNIILLYIITKCHIFSLLQ